MLRTGVDSGQDADGFEAAPGGHNEESIHCWSLMTCAQIHKDFIWAAGGSCQMSMLG